MPERHHPYWDVVVRVPGGDPLSYFVQTPSDLDARAQARRMHADVARLSPDDIEVVSVTEVEPGG